MNERIQQLAEQAGFVLWQDESHNPGDVIDWGSRYDDELVKFAELVIQECINDLHRRGWTDAGNDLQKHYNDNNTDDDDIEEIWWHSIK